MTSKYGAPLDQFSYLIDFTQKAELRDNPEMHAEALAIYKLFGIDSPVAGKVFMFSDEPGFDKVMRTLKPHHDHGPRRDALRKFATEVRRSIMGTSYRVAPDVIVTNDDGDEYTPPAVYILV